MPENYDVKTLSYAIARDPVYSIYDNIYIYICIYIYIYIYILMIYITY